MTKEELEKVIENGESVWCYYVNEKEVEELDIPTHRHKIENDELIIQNDWFYPLKYLFKTKAEAEHYLHHANITRTETLPFLTWEEFKQRGTVYFRDKYFDEYKLLKDVIWNDNKNTTEYCLKIHCLTTFNTIKLYNYNEENFYKAYDECVKLFVGVEDE